MSHQLHDWGGGSEGEPARFQVDPAAGCVVLTAAGEIDVRTVPGLDQAVGEALGSSPFLVIDLTQVSFLDSRALGVLIGARRHANESGGAVLLVHPPDFVRKILVTTQLQHYFAVYDSLDDALAALRGS